MPALPLRTDFDAKSCRLAARHAGDASQARRLLSIAAIYDGAGRDEAATLGSVTVQTVCDWVKKFNAHEAMPLLTIEIDAISDQLLESKAAENDYTIIVEAGEHGRLVLGRIMREARALGRTAWFWTITGPVRVQANLSSSGEAECLEGGAGVSDTDWVSAREFIERITGSSDHPEAAVQ